MSKGVSLDIIRKCLEKIKNWVSGELANTIKSKASGNQDFNELTTAGFYRVGEANTNAPTGGFSLYPKWGNVVTIRGGTADTLCQLYFSSKPCSYFSARWGGTTIDPYSEQPWLYFHGSESPIIPTLGKRVHTNYSILESGFAATELDENYIIVGVNVVSEDSENDLIGIPFISKQLKKWYIDVREPRTNNHTSGKITLTIYYLNIKGYDIKTETISYNSKQLNDEGLAPQTNENSLNENFKQFKGDLINE